METPGRDRLKSFFLEPTARRVLLLGLLFGALVLFRALLVLFVFFVAFQRSIEALSTFVVRKTRLGHRAAVGLSALLVVGVFGGLLALGADRLARAVVRAKESFPDRVAAIRDSDFFVRLREHLPGVDRITSTVQQHAQDALHVASALGHILAFAVIGLILAVVFLLEREELDRFRASLEPASIIGTFVRWLGHVDEAIAVTLKLQVIVATFNALTTLPVLLALGVHHCVGLMMIVFVSGLVPVAGNFASGVILALFAYQARGLLGVAIFAVLTFVLHKIEAYYLNPRLTKQHVHLPGFVLIASILAFENVFGFVGFFLSFPFLFVAARIRAEWAETAEG